MILEQLDTNRVQHIKPIKKGNVLLQAFRRIRGVHWWELNLKTGDIKQVKFDQINAGYKAGVQYRIDVKKDHLYCPAINKDNAERKFYPMVEKLIMQGTILQYT